mmetsp:Transcript_81282/g.161322  ORF Transcript_81282/g.161322 Transcript_81282/m.161322 type:complete len:592 (-) Transcript_81282:184-1959(-)
MVDQSLVSWERGFGQLEVEDATCFEHGAVLLPLGAHNDVPGSSSSDNCNGGNVNRRSTTDCNVNMPPPPWATDIKADTNPPVRLRMQCRDMLCRRSMEVSWQDGMGGLHTWSSWNDPLCSWFECEKLLPATVTHVRVWFQVRTVVRAVSVKAVDRSLGCRWVENTQGGQGYPAEVFAFRTGFGTEVDPIDAIFELRGPALHCHVWRAWNVGMADDTHEAWECWDEDSSRPSRQPQPKVLQAADKVAAPGAGAGDPVIYFAHATLRLVAAARALLDIKTASISELEELDRSLSSQWVAVNSVNTLSAGLGVAAAVSLLVAPPAGMTAVGVALGLGSAVTGGGASAGDAVVDHSNLRDLRHKLQLHSWNEFAVLDLEQEWIWARRGISQQVVGCSSSLCPEDSPQEETEGRRDSRDLASHGAQFGASVAKVLADMPDTSSSSSIARAAAGASDVATPVAAKVLGVTGAAVSVGVAVHGWASTKSIQATVRLKIKELHTSVLRTQRWLASLGQLECSACRCCINLSSEASSCQGARHYFHAHCLRKPRASQAADEGNIEGRVEEGTSTICPLCDQPLQQTCVLEELLAAGSLDS